jgi:hypothetical protein
MTSLSVLVLSLFLLSSCSSLSYKEPTTGPRARVRFVTDTKEITVLRVFDDASCTQNATEWMLLRVGPFLNSSPKVLGIPLWNYHDNAAKEVYVEANKQITGFFRGAETPFPWSPILTTYYCAVVFSYNFSEGKDYEVSFKWDQKNCRVDLSEIVSDNEGGYKRSSITNPINESIKACMAQIQKNRLY